MPRGARIAGWVYFPIHVAVLPLTIGMLLMAVLGKLPSDVTCWAEWRTWKARFRASRNGLTTR